MFVGGVDENGLARLLAPHDVHVVLHGPDHDLVHLDQAVLVVEHVLSRLSGPFPARRSCAGGRASPGSFWPDLAGLILLTRWSTTAVVW